MRQQILVVFLLLFSSCSRRSSGRHEENKYSSVNSDSNKVKSVLSSPSAFSVAGNEQSPFSRDGNDRMEERQRVCESVRERE